MYTSIITIGLPPPPPPLKKQKKLTILFQPAFLKATTYTKDFHLSIFKYYMYAYINIANAQEKLQHTCN